ncbi:VOC family protein [Nocardioides sp. AE5]|uniref:VOC family protein n=1 Tax=Nocardioides sp. AE5 TaxID=2962573 RepID=UPI00288163A0|nr:VOC family protein [Nocardioides sp. AE5]MDT0203041.1 VOC family protein [Nocardioides sp. AE5]
MIFPNLPVKDVERAKEFWTQLGFGFNEEFSSPDAACLVINDSASVMLLAEKFFHSFHDTTPHTGTEVMLALGVGSREEVDRLCEAAVAAGGTADQTRTEDGPMYGGWFLDPDGHIWEPLWMAA